MSGEQILIVEDQRAVAGALKMRLRGLGYDVSAIAKDGFEAIEKASELMPDLILMDVRLGDGIDGIEAAQRIRSRHDIPVVYISAHADLKLLARARATRPAGFINKPFTTKDLLTAIDLALHREADYLDDLDLHLGRDATSGERPKDGVITADSDSRIGFMNAAAESLIGWHRRQVLGRPLADLVSVLYDVPLARATALVTHALASGGEESLTRPPSGRFSSGSGTQPQIDTLTPLYDSRGQIYGVALKLVVGQKSETALDTQTDRALGKALDAVPHGVLVVNSDLQIQFSNRAARDTVTRNRGIEFRNDTVTVSDKQLDLRLRELIQLAVAKAKLGQDQATGTMFVRSPMARDHVELIVAPVPALGQPEASVRVLLYLFDSNSPRQVSYDVLTGLYGLTQTEAKLVQLMTNGMSLDEAAEELEISVNTARTHLKHIFHKTGINRQTELLHRIERGPAALLVRFDSAPSGK